MTTGALDEVLASAERILLDSSTLIAYHSRLETTHPFARHILSRIEDGNDRLHGYFSVVSAAELLIRPYRAGIAEFTLMHTFLTGFPNLTPLAMDLQVAVQAATIRSTTGLRLPDAIIAASGLSADCEAIITNDEEWKRKLEPLFPGLAWVYLGDYLS